MRLIFAFLLLGIFFYLPFFLIPGTNPISDWDYFQSKSLIVKSLVLQYQVFPLHNPWACGGLDVLANPQNRIFTPFIFLDLFLSPKYANILSLIFHSVFGLWGAFKFFTFIGRGYFSAFSGAFLFIGSSWFGLHYAQGHIPYGAIQLIPLACYLFCRYDSKKHFFFLGLLFASFILEGAIYCAIFTIYAILTALYCQIGGLNTQKLIGYIRHSKAWVLSCFGVFISLASLKLIPFFWVKTSFFQTFQTSNVDFSDLFWMLLNPFQDPHHVMQNSTVQWQGHEFGMYLGLAIPILFFISLRLKTQKKTRLLVAIVFWSWAALGWGDAFNPWTLHELSPFSYAHVQSRLSILSLLFLLVLITQTLDHLKTRLGSGFFFAILFVLFVEHSVARIYPFYKVQQNSDGIVLNNATLIKSTQLTQTIESFNNVEHYLTGNKGSKLCYEPSVKIYKAKEYNNPDYKGEIYWDTQTESNTSPSKNISIQTYTPGYIEISYSSEQENQTFTINTNHLGGWISLDPQVEILSKNGELLRLRVKNNSGTVQLIYRPKYIIPLIFFGLIGLFGTIFLYRRTRNQPVISN
jgi:hypothetical protein